MPTPGPVMASETWTNRQDPPAGPPQGPSPPSPGPLILVPCPLPGRRGGPIPHAEGCSALTSSAGPPHPTF